MFNAKRTQSSTNWSAIPVSPVVEEQVEWYLNVRAKRTLFTQALSANPASLGADLIEARIFDEARETRMVERELKRARGGQGSVSAPELISEHCFPKQLKLPFSSEARNARSRGPGQDTPGRSCLQFRVS